MIVRIFKTKALARFTKREAISDEGLVAAIETARHGLIDADLGGGLVHEDEHPVGGPHRAGHEERIGGAGVDAGS